MTDHETCPVSGLKITTDPAWVMSDPDGGYKVRFFLIGDRILFSHPSGFATSESTKKSLAVNHLVEHSILKNELPYVQIENFTQLNGFTINARLTYIRYFQKRPGICGLIFWGVSFLTSLSIKIAAKMYLADFPIKVVQSYEEAVRTSIDMLEEKSETESNQDRKTSESTFFKGSRFKGEVSNSDKIQVQSDPDWSINMDGYNTQYEIINGHIIHSRGSGYFEKQQIEPVIEIQKRLFQKLKPNKSGFHMVADVSKITGTSYHTRLLYTQAQNNFYNEYQFQSLTFYGASKTVKAAVYLGRPFVKFKVFLADTFEDSLNLIYGSRNDPKNITRLKNKRAGEKNIDAYQMDVLKYLGSLNLDVETPGYERVEFPEDHPFGAVFETIDLIGHDLNQIALEKKKNELQKIELERKLAIAQKMQALGTLSGGIAHDFNNILSGIIGYCELAKMNMDNPQKARDQIDQIYRGAMRAAGLVKQILIFSRNTEYKKTPRKLAPVVEEAMMLLRSSIPATIKIKENIVSQKTVLADTAKIHQIIMNLCTNAYQAMYEPGGSLTVSLIDVGIYGSQAADLQMRPGGYILLEVADTGHGMSTGTLARIFDPYFTTKEIGKGTGLGLSLVYAIVHEHGGYIKVESILQKGSTFKVYFPVADGDIDSDEKNSVPMARLTGDEQIMVVDDEESILESTGEILTGYGYRVSSYPDGEKAFQAFVSNPRKFDLVLTDMTMPGMTGAVLAKKIMELRPDLPIVLCTGYNEQMSEKNALDMGIKRFVQKPFASQSIAEIIREVLDSLDIG